VPGAATTFRRPSTAWRENPTAGVAVVGVLRGPCTAARHTDAASRNSCRASRKTSTADCNAFGAVNVDISSVATMRRRVAIVAKVRERTFIATRNTSLVSGTVVAVDTPGEPVSRLSIAADTNVVAVARDPLRARGQAVHGRTQNIGS
jgi:hypothetical protein